MNRICYKSFDEKLQGKNEFCYKVGSTYTQEGDDTWRWLHYAKYISSTLSYFGHAKKIRICIVEPIGKIHEFKGAWDGYKGCYSTTTKLHIVRELTDDEILLILEKEKCPFMKRIKYIRASYEYLISHKNCIRGDNIVSELCNRTDLSNEELMNLLPKSQQGRIKRRELQVRA